MSRQTTLNNEHVQANALMVDFAGWQMPMHYGSQLDEHHAVRQSAGMFDVSHMTIVDITGDNAKSFLRYLLANDISTLNNNQALYSCLLNEDGMVLDDLIVYRYDDDHYRLVVNAATREKDLDWINKQNEKFHCNLKQNTDLSIIALQGPDALAIANAVFPNHNLEKLKPFYFNETDNTFIARTGYTGENGFEILCPNDQTVSIWQQLQQHGAKPCGLGARDTLRLEAGFNLYGHDMDESTHPFESNLTWTLKLKDDRDFIGKEALLKIKNEGIDKKFVGIVLQDRGVLRDGMIIEFENGETGIITSGSFSPTLKQAIALARIPNNNLTTGTVNIRNKKILVNIVKPSFVKNGHSL